MVDRNLARSGFQSEYYQIKGKCQAPFAKETHCSDSNMARGHSSKLTSISLCFPPPNSFFKALSSTPFFPHLGGLNIRKRALCVKKKRPQNMGGFMGGGFTGNCLDRILRAASRAPAPMNGWNWNFCPSFGQTSPLPKTHAPLSSHRNRPDN